MLLLEDLHWIDESSLAVVNELAGRVAGVRMLLLLTHRSAKRLPGPIEPAGSSPSGS